MSFMVGDEVGGAVVQAATMHPATAATDNLTSDAMRPSLQ
jgi:hypothetical protein